MSFISHARNRTLQTGRLWWRTCGIPQSETEIAIVGKYIQPHDAYLSVVEALKHGGIASRGKRQYPLGRLRRNREPGLPGAFERGRRNPDRPGGFGHRGTEGKIQAVRYARENKIRIPGNPVWGMQMAIVEFARNVAGF